MSKFPITIDFSSVDLDALETEEDFKTEAKQLLPQALQKLGESIGEQTWEELENNLKQGGSKSKGSQLEKRKFIQETGRTYQRKASSREKQELEDYIIEQLRDLHRQRPR
ncbi:hypothetical protein H6G76_23300 [Nostoc sp. FACHB-152]|uniref:hypothetical protein n=1 Tax=unclassified Nostoc TaxID=2593658 RepID=UPI0016855EF9|nr:MULTISPECIES: hypothetical protein [unclassified Nostoc]MBD2450035.1 hypothetical protein [Nostoc sp. FACHB-152]MBD2470155.1 hypothetical protein [Nostoc sp. FACHB-145]